MPQAKNVAISLLIAIFFSLPGSLIAQSSGFSRQDSLRGDYGAGRQSWDLLQYDLHLIPSIENQIIRGINSIKFLLLKKGPIQLDLQNPMEIDSILLSGRNLNYSKEGNTYWLNEGLPEPGNIAIMKVYFHGKPPTAINPPWDGGWIYTSDKAGNPWISVACQDIGASCWFPCKESQQDEPDSGAVISIDVPDTLMAVANGRLSSTLPLENNLRRFTWRVNNPINNYCLIPYIGKYIRIQDVYEGLNGKLDLDYWVLPDNRAKAEVHFKQVKKMLQAFEYWFGPYPFYSDGYKLVDAPHLGMEHQSAIAYGNEYTMGYRGKDLSGSGHGLLWDFIIIHESGHEWFGNSITSRDIADIWIHEAFTTYSEVLFTEFHHGKKAADEYCQGLRENIGNEAPCIGAYGVHDNPANRTSDMYFKGANMLHTIRQICNDDEKFKKLLKEINKQFGLRETNSSEVEALILKYTGVSPSIFDQYLRSTKIPELEYCIKGRDFYYRWNNTEPHFSMPLKVTIKGPARKIIPTQNWKHLKIKGRKQHSEIPVAIDKNYFITVKSCASD